MPLYCFVLECQGFYKVDFQSSEFSVEHVLPYQLEKAGKTQSEEGSVSAAAAGAAASFVRLGNLSRSALTDWELLGYRLLFIFHKYETALFWDVNLTLGSGIFCCLCLIDPGTHKLEAT